MPTARTTCFIPAQRASALVAVPLHDQNRTHYNDEEDDSPRLEWLHPWSVHPNTRGRSTDLTVTEQLQPPVFQYIVCFECRRQQAAYNCEACGYAYCPYHIERHWWCCLPPLPDDDSMPSNAA